MKKTFLLTVFIGFLFLIVVAGCTQSDTPAAIAPINDNQADSNIELTVGNDTDEHGCIGSAGYSWCEPKNTCLRIWEQACYSSPEQEIQYRLAKKYNKPVAEITVVATEKTSDYMSGSVSFAAPGLPTPAEGGLFLAVKEGNMWTLIYDGNGSIDCNQIKQAYKFPQEMLVGFCD